MSNRSSHCGKIGSSHATGIYEWLVEYLISASILAAAKCFLQNIKGLKVEVSKYTIRFPIFVVAKIVFKYNFHFYMIAS